MSVTPGKIWAASLALLLGAARAEAAQLSGPETGVVPYAMGRAYSAIADDSLSLQYNPAGLALVRRVEFQAFDLKLESNQDVLTSYNHLKSLSNSNGTLSGQLSSLAGKHIMASFQEVTQLTLPYAALAVMYDNHIDFDLENLSYPTTYMRYTKDFTVIGGFGVPLDNRKDLRVGASLKFTSRTGGERRVPISQIMGNKNAISSLFTQTGTGWGGDLGMQYRLPVRGRTEFTTSFVWHDIGQTSFGDIQAVNPPTPLAQNMVAGAAIRFPIGGGQNRRLLRRYGPTRSTSALSFVFDYDHLNKSWNDEALVKHLHEGINLDLPLFSFQVGLNQTALTFGSTFDIGLVKVSLATYGEELGSYAGQRVDRRYLLSIGSVLGFDAGK